MPTAKKEQTIYRHIVNDAWKITWQRKELWVFGLFAALTWGGGAINYISDITTRFSSGVPFDKSEVTMRLFLNQFASPVNSMRIFAIICAIILIALVLASITSMGAIMNAAAKHGVNQKSVPREDLVVGGRSFWRIFAVVIICRLVAVLLLFSVGLTFSGYIFIAPIFSVFYVLLFTATCLVSLFLWFISSTATAAVVVDNLNIHEALSAACILLKKHWLVAIETTAILFAATIIAALAIIIATIVLSLPFTALLFAASFMKSAIFMYILIIFAVVASVAIIVVAGSALSVFTQSTWALLYKRLGTRGGVAKLERLFAKFKK
jgi:hypothetical protein